MAGGEVRHSSIAKMVRAAVATKAKKKPGDFKRPKRKVGRRAPQAANVTSVGISSRRINLLAQSALQDKGDATTTRRNLTLQDLLAQVAHYNPHVRQRALQGLRELAAQPQAAANLLANVAVLLERFLPAFVDEEAVVRDAAVAAWKALLPVLVDGKSLSPFAALVAVYCCSGLTHLQVGVRRDTLRAISALLDVAPALLCVEAGTENLGRLIENFKDLIAAAQAQGIKVKNSYNLLNAEASGNAKKGKSKKAVSSGLALRFQGLMVLHKLLSAMRSSSASAADLAANVRQTRYCAVQSTRTLLLYAPPRLVTTQTAAGPSSSLFWQEKSRSLLKPLLDLWLECLENEVVDTLAEDYIEHLHYVVECVELITSSNVNHLVTLDPKQSLLKTVFRLQDELLLQRFPMFPSAMLADDNDPSMARWYVMNIALSKFACVFLSSPDWIGVPQRAELEARVYKFVISTLNKFRESTELRSVSATQPIVSGLLGVLSQLLKSESARCSTEDEAMEDTATTGANGKQALLESFTRFYSVCSPRSTLFRMCTTFVVSYLTVTKPWPAWTEILDWMQCFAKLLGHLESGYMSLARQCLSIMISVMKQLPSDLAESNRMEATMNNLITFFDVSTTTEDRKSSRFDDLTPSDQVEFVALVYHLPSYPVALVRALTGCCKSTRVTSQAKSFMIDILFQRREALDIAHLVSFLMSSALNTTTVDEEAAGVGYKEHLELVHHVCRVFQNMHLGASLPKILRPALSRQLSDQSNTHLHTLILLYRTCLLSTAPLGDSLSSEIKLDPEMAAIAADMEKTLIGLLTKGLIDVFSHRASGSLAVESLNMLENDCVSTLEICVTRILVLVSRALVESSGDSETITRNLRVLQSLTRSPRLTVLVARRRNDIAELLAPLEGSHINEQAARLVRQLRGDLDLVAAGRS